MPLNLCLSFENILLLHHQYVAEKGMCNYVKAGFLKMNHLFCRFERLFLTCFCDIDFIFLLGILWRVIITKKLMIEWESIAVRTSHRSSFVFDPFQCNG